MKSFNAYKLILVSFYLTSQFADIFSLPNPTVALDSNHYAMMLPWSIINIMLILIKKFLTQYPAAFAVVPLWSLAAAAIAMVKKLFEVFLLHIFGPRKKVSVVFH